MPIGGVGSLTMHARAGRSAKMLRKSYTLGPSFEHSSLQCAGCSRNKGLEQLHDYVKRS